MVYLLGWVGLALFSCHWIQIICSGLGVASSSMSHDENILSSPANTLTILSQSKPAYNHPLTWQCIDKSIKIVINIFTICVYSKYHEVWHTCKQVRPGATPYSQMQCQLPRHLYFITHGITKGHGLHSSLESSVLIRGQGSWWVLPKYASI